MKAIINGGIRSLYVILGIIILSSFIDLFKAGINLNLLAYIKSFKHVVISLVNHELLRITNSGNIEYSIFKIGFWDYYQYSIILLLLSFLLALFIGFSLTYITLLLPRKLVNPILSIASFLESIPDLFTIIVFQYLVILFYKSTGILLFPIAGSFDNAPYLLPIVILSIVPSLLIYRIFLLFSNEEWEKSYVYLAKGKGLNMSRIYFTHIIRNIIPNITNHSKSILLLLLSNMVVFEKIFNISGIMTFIITYPEPNIIAFSLIVFYIPIFFLFSLTSMVVYFFTNQRTVM